MKAARNMSAGPSEASEHEVEAKAAAVMARLPAAMIDAAFSREVSAAAREELRAGHAAGGRQRRQSVFARVVMPLVLLACAGGYAYHFVQVADRIYLSHGG